MTSTSSAGWWALAMACTCWQKASGAASPQILLTWVGGIREQVRVGWGGVRHIASWQVAGAHAGWILEPRAPLQHRALCQQMHGKLANSPSLKRWRSPALPTQPQPGRLACW